MLECFEKMYQIATIKNRLKIAQKWV